MPTVTYTPIPPTPPRAPAPACAVCGKAPAYQCGRCIGCYSIALVMGADHVAPGNRPTLPLPPLPTTNTTMTAPPKPAAEIGQALHACHNSPCTNQVRRKGYRCSACQSYWKKYGFERPSGLVKRSNLMREAYYARQRAKTVTLREGGGG